MTPEEIAELEAALANHEASQSGPASVDMTDPERLEFFQRTFNLSPEEAAELAVPSPEGGPSLADRLERLRPGANIGGWELTVDGSIKEPRIEGRYRF